MSYNILGKNASFKGDVSGTIENQVNDWDNQSISGSKSFAATISSSADVMLSGSGKVSASFFYGDGSGLSGVGGTITSYSSHATDRLIAGGASSTAIKGVTGLSYATSKLSVTGELSASTNISASQFYGNGTNVTALVGNNITSGLIPTARISLASDGALESDPSSRLRVKVSASNGLMTGSNGLHIDAYNHLGNEGSYNSSNVIIVQGSSGPPKKQALTVLQTNMTIAGGNITGTNSINNTRLPTTIAQQVLSASTAISGAFIEGDGGGLINVTAGGAGADTQVQFNDGGNLAGNAGFTFGKTTAVMSVTTGSFTKISSSLVPDVNNAFYLGASDLSSRWANVASVNGNYSGVVVMLTGAVSGKLAVGNLNPLNEFEVTGSSHFIGNVSASVNVSASAFYGSAANLTNTINTIDNYTANRLLVAGGDASNIDAVSQITFNNPLLSIVGSVSASADLQVGGHITGSGDAVIGGTIYWDRTGTGTGTGPKLTPGGSPANSLNIDGDSIITIQADTNARFRVGDASTPDLILDITPTVVSSSVPITGSVLHTNGGITMPGGGGGTFTFLSDQGNVTAGSIEMLAGGSDVLNFNDNSISGSGNISGSAFYGDGSNLQNVSATPQFRYYTIRTKTTINNLFNSAQTMDLYDQGGTASGINQSSNELTWFSAPGSGSIARVIYTPIQSNSTATTNTIRTTDNPQFYFRKNSIVEGTPVQGIQAHTTASSANMKSLSVTNQAGTFSTQVAIFDMENNNPVVSGSNSFDPGDVLVFAGRNDQTVHPLMVTIVLKIQEEGVTYP